MRLSMSVDAKAPVKGPGVLVRVTILKVALCCNGEIWCNYLSDETAAVERSE
jgi:hypothetical protein